jgi:hypothetical protein
MAQTPCGKPLLSSRRDRPLFAQQFSLTSHRLRGLLEITKESPFGYDSALLSP